VHLHAGSCDSGDGHARMQKCRTRLRLRLRSVGKPRGLKEGWDDANAVSTVHLMILASIPKLATMPF